MCMWNAKWTFKKGDIRCVSFCFLMEPGLWSSLVFMGWISCPGLHLNATSNQLVVSNQSYSMSFVKQWTIAHKWMHLLLWDAPMSFMCLCQQPSTVARTQGRAPAEPVINSHCCSWFPHAGCIIRFQMCLLISFLKQKLWIFWCKLEHNTCGLAQIQGWLPALMGRVGTAQPVWCHSWTGPGDSRPGPNGLFPSYGSRWLCLLLAAIQASKSGEHSPETFHFIHLVLSLECLDFKWG